MARNNKRKAEVEAEAEVEAQAESESEAEEREEDSLGDEVLDDEFAGSEDDADEGDAGDGLANTMAQLLQQSTGSKIPILAGRKTKLMKEMEASKKESEGLHKKRDERRKKIYDKMASASSVNVQLERDLRKLATKGVVALFNAVAKSKREAHAEELLKKKKFSHENDAASLVTTQSSLPTSSLLKKDSDQKTNKAWKAVSDEQIPLDWDKDED